MHHASKDFLRKVREKRSKPYIVIEPTQKRTSSRGQVPGFPCAISHEVSETKDFLSQTVGFCPVCGAVITRYDCSEICCGADYGRIPNDGIPPLMSVAEIQEKKDLCVNCEHRKSKGYKRQTRKRRTAQSCTPLLLFHVSSVASRFTL